MSRYIRILFHVSKCGCSSKPKFPVDLLQKFRALCRNIVWKIHAPSWAVTPRNISCDRNMSNLLGCGSIRSTEALLYSHIMQKGTMNIGKVRRAAIDDWRDFLEFNSTL